MRLSHIVWLVLLLPCALLAQPDRITAPIDARRAVVLHGNVRPMAQPQFDQGPVEPVFRLGYVTLMLKKTDAQQAALEQLLDEQQDAASPDYHNWLTPEQYAERFGLSQHDLDRISAWLQAEGFTVEYVARGRNWLAFSGTAGQVQAAFQTEIHRYRVDGEMHFAAAAEPWVPAALEPVVAGFAGLDDFYPKPPRHPLPAYTDTSTGAHTLAPGDLAAIYDIAKLYQAGIDGTGQSIVVVGQSVVNSSDIQGFRTNYNLPTLALQTKLYGGSPPAADSSALAEADMDLEWVGAVAHNATLIYVYGNSAEGAAAYAIDKNLAPVISESFGDCEATVASLLLSYRSLAQQANAQGITWLAASGDDGAAGCDYQVNIATQGLAVVFPASIPEVTGVGATEFNEGSGTYWNTTNGANGGSAISYIPEKAWNDTATQKTISASGGGASSVYPKPAWQTGAGVPSDGARDVPDVSIDGADHDPYNVMTGGAWKLYAGTSVSTPVFAGIVALLNHYLVKNKVQSAPGVGNINPMLYRLAQSVPNAFHDITVGNNVVPCKLGTPDCTNAGTLGYSAGPGYDLATGLGSVDAYNLVTQWSSAPAVGTTTTVTANPTSILPSGSTTLTATVKAASGSIAPMGSVSFTLGGASLGTVNLSGSGGTASASLTVNASQLTTGNNAITASFGASNGFAASSGSVTVSVGVPTVPATVVPSVTPNPVFQAPDGTFLYTVRLSEIAGTAATLTGFTMEGFDHSSQIQNWFGSASIPPNGTISAALGSQPSAVPVNWVLGFSGTDASGAAWAQQITVPFRAQPSSASMALASSPSTVALVADTTHCTSQYPYYQQLNLQEQNGYEVQLTRFLAGGSDDSSNIASWFGSLRLAPFGSLQAGICWNVSNPPGTLAYEVDGTDTAGNAIVATLSVLFQSPASSPGALTVSTSSVAMSADPTESAAATVTVNVPAGQPWTVSMFPASQKSGWLVVFPLSGTGPTVVNLVAAAPGLANGAYTTTLIFQSANTTPQFVNVPIAFTIGASSAVSIGGVANAASYLHSYAPGMALSVFGTNLAPSTQTAYALPLPLMLAGVSATVNGVPAPLYFVSPLQLNIQIPYETATGTALLAVSNNGQVATYSFPVSASAPGLYTADQSGSGPITLNPSGNRGQIYTLFVTGVGDVSPPVSTGAGPAGAQVPVPLLAVSVTIGGVAASLQYLGIPSWSVGTLQVNFTVPPNAPLGVQSVVVTVGSASSPAAATFTVSQ
jgi:uncharacterized protein (TIGR03437 family)